MGLWLMVAGGLALLTVGAELLVRGASRLAEAAKISPLVIGLTVVAYGTSMPELVVSARSAFAGEAGIALGNVVGSNIFNVLFILGLSALIVPLRVERQLIRFDVPILVAVSLLTGILALDGRLGFADGLLLVTGMIAYTVVGIGKSRQTQLAVERNTTTADTAPRPSSRNLLGQTGLVVAGLLLLVVGASWFTEGAIQLARRWDISELVVGLTIVAAGTSLPEVATSVMAALKGERDIAVGNVIGSNLFNLLGVLGISGILATDGIPISPAALWFDIPVMIAVALLCLPVFISGREISRWEGGLLLFYWIAYTAFLILAELRPDQSRLMGQLMLGLVIPLTVLLLCISTIRSIRRPDAPAV